MPLNACGWGAQAQQALAALSRVPALASNAQLPILAALRGPGAGTALQQQVRPPACAATKPLHLSDTLPDKLAAAAAPLPC